MRLEEYVLQELGGISGALAARNQVQANRSQEKANNWRTKGLIGGAASNLASAPSNFIKKQAAGVRGFVNQNAALGDTKRAVATQKIQPAQMTQQV